MDTLFAVLIIGISLCIGLTSFEAEPQVSLHEMHVTIIYHRITLKTAGEIETVLHEWLPDADTLNVEIR